MEAHRIKREDLVKVTVYDAEGREIGIYSGHGMHNIEEAVDNAANSLGLSPDSRRECVYEIENKTEDYASPVRYRFNAHGNLKLIVE